MANNNSDTERRLWDAADEFRANSDLKSSEYATPVLGLIFLRYADHRFTQAEKKLKGKGTGRRKIGKEGRNGDWYGLLKIDDLGPWCTWGSRRFLFRWGARIGRLARPDGPSLFFRAAYLGLRPPAADCDLGYHSAVL